ncbi:MAG: chemotaxis protein CheW [Clostridiaceae bacterium]|nr:chemotaxis protein CheW [Clostridiaceae bacterium]
MSNDTSALNQYVIFKLQEEHYGISIKDVETIEKVSEITRLPNSPSYVQGVINLRGEVVPVIDLRKRFEMEIKENTEETRIIILNIEEMIIGIVVDSSSEVLTIPVDTIDNTFDLVNTLEDDYVKGIGKVEDRMIIILDMLKALNITAS